jgi:hypothetical protein
MSDKENRYALVNAIDDDGDEDEDHILRPLHDQLLQKPPSSFSRQNLTSSLQSDSDDGLSDSDSDPYSDRKSQSTTRIHLAKRGKRDAKSWQRELGTTLDGPWWSTRSEGKRRAKSRAFDALKMEQSLPPRVAAELLSLDDDGDDDDDDDNEEGDDESVSVVQHRRKARPERRRVVVVESDDDEKEEEKEKSDDDDDDDDEVVHLFDLPSTSQDEAERRRRRKERRRRRMLREIADLKRSNKSFDGDYWRGDGFGAELDFEETYQTCRRHWQVLYGDERIPLPNFLRLFRRQWLSSAALRDTDYGMKPYRFHSLPGMKSSRNAAPAVSVDASLRTRIRRHQAAMLGSSSHRSRSTVVSDDDDDEMPSSSDNTMRAPAKRPRSVDRRPPPVDIDDYRGYRLSFAHDRRRRRQDAAIASIAPDIVAAQPQLRGRDRLRAQRKPVAQRPKKRQRKLLPSMFGGGETVSFAPAPPDLLPMLAESTPVAARTSSLTMPTMGRRRRTLPQLRAGNMCALKPLAVASDVADRDDALPHRVCAPMSLVSVRRLFDSLTTCFQGGIADCEPLLLDMTRYVQRHAAAAAASTTQSLPPFVNVGAPSSCCESIDCVAALRGAVAELAGVLFAVAGARLNHRSDARDRAALLARLCCAHWLHMLESSEAALRPAAAASSGTELVDASEGDLLNELDDFESQSMSQMDVGANPLLMEFGDDLSPSSSSSLSSLPPSCRARASAQEMCVDLLDEVLGAFSRNASALSLAPPPLATLDAYTSAATTQRIESPLSWACLLLCEWLDARGASDGGPFWALFNERVARVDSTSSRELTWDALFRLTALRTQFGVDGVRHTAARGETPSNWLLVEQLVRADGCATAATSDDREVLLRRVLSLCSVWPLSLGDDMLASLWACYLRGEFANCASGGRYPMWLADYSAAGCESTLDEIASLRHPSSASMPEAHMFAALLFMRMRAVGSRQAALRFVSRFLVKQWPATLSRVAPNAVCSAVTLLLPFVALLCSHNLIKQQHRTLFERRLGALADADTPMSARLVFLHGAFIGARMVQERGYSLAGVAALINARLHSLVQCVLADEATLARRQSAGVAEARARLGTAHAFLVNLAFPFLVHVFARRRATGLLDEHAFLHQPTLRSILNPATRFVSAELRRVALRALEASLKPLPHFGTVAEQSSADSSMSTTTSDDVIYESIDVDKMVQLHNERKATESSERALAECVRQLPVRGLLIKAMADASASSADRYRLSTADQKSMIKTMAYLAQLGMRHALPELGGADIMRAWGPRSWWFEHSTMPAQWQAPLMFFCRALSDVRAASALSSEADALLNLWVLAMLERKLSLQRLLTRRLMSVPGVQSATPLNARVLDDAAALHNSASFAEHRDRMLCAVVREHGRAWAARSRVAGTTAQHRRELRQRFAGAFAGVDRVLARCLAAVSDGAADDHYVRTVHAFMRAVLDSPCAQLLYDPSAPRCVLPSLVNLVYVPPSAVTPSSPVFFEHVEHVVRALLALNAGGTDVFLLKAASLTLCSALDRLATSAAADVPALRERIVAGLAPTPNAPPAVPLRAFVDVIVPQRYLRSAAGNGAGSGWLGLMARILRPLLYEWPPSSSSSQQPPLGVMALPALVRALSCPALLPRDKARQHCYQLAGTLLLSAADALANSRPDSAPLASIWCFVLYCCADALLRIVEHECPCTLPVAACIGAAVAERARLARLASTELATLQHARLPPRVPSAVEQALSSCCGPPPHVANESAPMKPGTLKLFTSRLLSRGLFTVPSASDWSQAYLMPLIEYGMVHARDAEWFKQFE